MHFKTFFLLLLLSLLGNSCQGVVIDIKESPAESSSAENRAVTNRIVFWGHSAGAILEPALEKELRKRINVDFSFEKCSASGENMLQIAARQGAIPAFFYGMDCDLLKSKYKIGDNSHPLISSYDGTAIPFSVMNGINPCVINNCTGVLSKQNSSYFFEPDDLTGFSLEEINFIETAASSNFRCPLYAFFWCDQQMDRNDVDALIDKYEIMADYNGNSHYLIIGSIVGDENSHRTVESRLRAAFSQHYFNAREFLVSEAEKNIDSFSSEDVVSIKKGKVPSIWMKDSLHLNSKGAELVAREVVNIIINIIELNDE